MPLRKPDFFILGAPKSGTTALTAYLADHPAVFLADVKDTDFFATDFNHPLFENEQEYMALFRDVPASARTVGESATRYLESTVAVPAILDFNPSARFIVMLRNPVEMAAALHAQMIWEGMETELDFAAAWRANDPRRQGIGLPVTCRDPKLVCYRDACRVGTFMQRVFNTVDRERVLVLIFDDFKRDAQAAYRQTLEFLEVPDDGRAQFPIVNPRRQVKRPWLHKALSALGSAKRRLGIRRGLGVHGLLARHVFSEQRHASPDPEMRVELANAFACEVALLSRLLDRDLSHWLAAKDGAPR